MHHQSVTRRITNFLEESCGRGTRIGNLRVALFLVPLVLCPQLLAWGRRGVADVLTSAQAPDAQTTLAIFTDPKAHQLTNQQWEAIAVALREELVSDSPEIQSLAGKAAGADSNSQIQIILGDRITPGLSVQNSITVFLHGDCTILPHPPPIVFPDTQVSGALGWVNDDHGRIQPFIHVQCNRLAQMLAAKAYGVNRGQRDQLMAVAIARVILHEWLHVATQSQHHSNSGLLKAQFSPADLLAGTGHSASQRGGK
jgi:hypothetical protein